jgi:hypothetical protein
VKKLGIVEASKRLGLHHTSVSRIATERPVARRTAARTRQRLATLVGNEGAQ